MAQYPDQLQFNGSIAGNYESQFVDCQGFSHVYCMVFSNASYSLSLDWSGNAGVDVDYQDTVSSLNTEVLSAPIRARWLKITVIPSAPPQSLRLNVSLNADSPGLVNLTNAGSGAKIYKSSVSKVRSLASGDGSVIIQELADTIDLSTTGLAVDNRDYTFASGSDVTFPSPAPADPKRAFWSRNSNIIYPQWLTPENVGVLRSISIQPFANLVTSSTGFCDTPTNITGGTVDFYLIEVTSSNYDLATATYNVLWHWEIPYTEFNTAAKNYECKSTYGNLTLPIAGGKKLSFLMTNNLTVSASAGFRALTAIFSFCKLQATEPLVTVGQVSANVSRVYNRVSTVNVIQLDVYNPTRPDLLVDLATDTLTFTATDTYTFNFFGNNTSNATYRLYINGVLNTSVSLASGAFSSSFPNVSINAGDNVQLIFLDGGAGTMTLGSYYCSIVN